MIQVTCRALSKGLACRYFLTPVILLLAGALFFTSCLSDSLPEPGESELPSVTKAVAPDGILETVTWNIKWFGSTSKGPSDELQQTKNILRITDSLKADLYAFQEVYNQQRLDSLTKYMTGYRGFVADYISYNQKMAFVYNTETIDSVSSGAITQGQSNYDWASGRFPLYFSFNYKYRGSSVPIYAVVIHAKANTGNSQKKEEAYNRRKRASDSLYTYLQKEQSDAHIILLGDFNDDVDVSIYDDASPSPYQRFINDNTGFRAVTKSISDNKQSSYIAGAYTDLIDHIIISDELFSNYNASSEEIYFEAGNFIENYVSTTSDHLPVWVKFDITRSQQKRRF